MLYHDHHVTKRQAINAGISFLKEDDSSLVLLIENSLNDIALFKRMSLLSMIFVKL